MLFWENPVVSEFIYFTKTAGTNEESLVNGGQRGFLENFNRSKHSKQLLNFCQHFPTVLGKPEEAVAMAI